MSEPRNDSRLSRWASSFMPSDVPHQLVTFADWMGVCLILRDLITRFTVGPCLLRGVLNIRRARCWLRPWTCLKATKMSGTRKVELKHWWPALMVHDRSCDCCQVRRLLRPAAMAYGQAGVGMICTLTPVLFQCSRGHWRMIKYSAGWGLGACRLFTRGFFSLLPPFLFYLSRNVCAFLHAPMWLQQRKRRICVEVCHRLVYNFSGSRLKAKGIQFARSENHLHAGSTGCAAAYRNQSVWVS